MSPTLIIHDPVRQSWLQFTRPRELIVATRLEEVIPALEKIRTLTERDFYAAGFLSYEAAPAFDSAFCTHAPTDFPLLWFGIYDEPGEVTPPPSEAPFALNWQITTTRTRYGDAIGQIKAAIARGDTYQVNFTIRQVAEYAGAPRRLFRQIAGNAPYGAFIETDDFAICSASPELFFRRAGQMITTRPMKGTAPRGRTRAEDERLREALFHSAKNRAENAMIVDMLRNDIGRIAQTGSVTVAEVFRIEKYPTVWQMTSTVRAETSAGITGIFRALFPCASITGAPKVSTMKIIAALEDGPRKIYTGSIGYITPGGDAQFSVAIRTALVDKRRHLVEYGIGGGIVWDSETEGEYRECLLKAAVITRPPAPRDFRLLETLLWEPPEGYFLLAYHLRRLQDSAAYFDFRCDLLAIRAQLQRLSPKLPPRAHKVRLLLNRNGQAKLEAAPLAPDRSHRPWQVRLATAPVDSTDCFLFHKTTHREGYARAKAAFPDADEVVLWNQRGEITEGCITNVVVKIDGRWVTPPVHCGLLGGTYRQFLLDAGQITERVVSVEEFRRAGEIALINSIRKWRPARLAGD